MIPLLCEVLKPLSDFVPTQVRIGVLGSGNRFTWEHREAVRYLTYLGLGFLIWKVRGIGLG